METPCNNDNVKNELIQKISENDSFLTIEQIEKAFNICCISASQNLEKCVTDLSKLYKQMGILFETSNENEKINILIECVNYVAQNSSIYTIEWKENVISMINRIENRSLSI